LTLTESIDQLGSDSQRSSESRKLPKRRLSEELFPAASAIRISGNRLVRYTILAESMPETGVGGQEESENFPAKFRVAGSVDGLLADRAYQP
jgi:hypothetical protein